MILLIIYLFKFSISEKYCKSSYDDQVEIMERCILKGTATFSGHKQTSIYLHNKKKSTLLFKINDSKISNNITEGKGIQIFDSKSEITCQSSQECFITIWHTSFNEIKSFFASDGAGCSVSSDNVISSDFSLFFDFGDNARLSSGNFTHKRETGIMIYYIDRKSNKVASQIITQDFDFDLSGPGILKISSSAYTKAIFDIIIGSTIKIPSSFSNSPVTSSFEVYPKIDKFNNDSYLSKSENTAEQGIEISMASERKGWYYLSIVMCGLTGIFFISSVASISVIFASYRKRQAKIFQSV